MKKKERMDHEYQLMTMVDCSEDEDVGACWVLLNVVSAFAANHVLGILEVGGGGS